MKVRLNVTAKGYIDIETGPTESGYPMPKDGSLWNLEVAAQKVPTRIGMLSSALNLDLKSHLGALGGPGVAVTVDEILLVDDEDTVIHNGLKMSLRQFRFLIHTFTHNGNGCCPCDESEGEEGCAFCNKIKTQKWKDGLDSLTEQLR